MRPSEIARLMVQLLLVAPAGSYAWYDADNGEIVVTVSSGSLLSDEKRVKLHRALDDVELS